MNRTMKMKHINIKQQAGFNLIEVLLAFLILSVGLLGVASLQTTAVRASHTAMLRTVAVTKVQELVERMRANPPSASDNYTLLDSYELVRGGNGVYMDCSEAGGSVVVACTPQDLAQNDLYVWKDSLVNAGLPDVGTDAEIKLDRLFNPPIVTVTVYWQERGEEMKYSTTIQL